MPHTWKPSLSPPVVSWIIFAISVQAAIRGSDYLQGDRESTTQALSVAEAAVPLYVWGAVLTAGGLSVAFGLAKKKYTPMLWGAILLMATYGALGWSLVLNVFDRATSWSAWWNGTVLHPDLGFAWIVRVYVDFPLDGWRTPSSIFTAAILWAFIAWGLTISHDAWREQHARLDE